MMRFNLRQLLALPLAFWLAHVVVTPFTFKLISYSWFRASIHVQNISDQIEIRQFNRREFEIEVVQRWVSGTLKSDDARDFHFAGVPDADPWGNRYRIKEFEDSRNNLRSIGVYSVGRDGVTMTNGDDPDDINSWSATPVAFYQREAQWERTREHIFAMLIAFPFSCVPLLYFLRTRHPNQTEQSVPSKSATKLVEMENWLGRTR